MANYSGDPYWTKERFGGKRCKRCGKEISRGESIFYYPKGKAIYCNGLCGKAASAEFDCAAEDEAFCMPQY